MSASEEESQGPIIRDRRRIDPVTGQPRQQAASAGAGQASGAGQSSRGPGQARPGKHSASKPGSLRPEAAGGGASAAEGQNGNGAPDTEAKTDGQPGDLARKLAERTADLQRVQAEYANYRKRVDRDRTAVREFALAGVLTELLPVLDDIGRARDHEELTGGFKAVADALESAVSKLGLSTFGKPGEVFDPNIHEALMHSYSADVTEPTCVQVLQPGYKVGERILRPARVAVAEPTDPAGARPASEEAPPSEGTNDDTSGDADAADDHTPDGD
ncbi:MAG TPA: nucleotide exchange factor GrpE [Streptosporangiaceae bacterium]|nr:nucleotide exchange factor GrpE [Streptosporangiaceae bacterium]